ncbi:glycosyltransferase family 2 protein [Euhalothece natronophila Z-M001]|uniref:Beta-monoglucosyldiacylglycerol synthase n=1 Tax=Euhalothece natronophila Z-M001 TaxID=522448 RepID=A0A5B8NR85_9CHRO|nr:glycosyltransferase family 2 protein [Euhalothece natronophila]QDZ41011.1 glycosyltransferase family 2 protein [Euhalothece natronophila Z-M001]
MPQNPWTDNNSYEELNPIETLLSDWSDVDNDEEDWSLYLQGIGGRRWKAAVTLMMVWGTTIALHLLAWGSWLVLGVTILFSIQVARIIWSSPTPSPQPLPQQDLGNAPTVSILVAAKNEEAVITELVESLCHLDYPQDKYEIWIIDDHSTDQTPALLDQLAQSYKQLRILHRPANATGGKSGALNQALSLSQGEIIAVFDADAQIPEDLLRHVVPFFQQASMGAVQVRKSIANAGLNFWTKGQAAEMALDSYFQQHRVSLGGIGELRGNGQFVRRRALASCGKWNEQTITDDLDLTIRLHLDQWEIGFLSHPSVQEEGVTSAIALWHQRNRWAEGGYQRYLDYWRWIIRNPMGFKKTLDLSAFLLFQYILPTAAIPDFLMVIVRQNPPLYFPATAMMFTLSIWGMLRGVQTTSDTPSINTAIRQTLRGTIYMLHWLLIIPSMTARVAVRPKKLNWVKTTHQGQEEQHCET